jgi:hypothetical protein
VVENWQGGRLGDGGRVCGAWAWTDETNNTWEGRKFSLHGQQLYFKGSGGEGGWRGGHRVEVEWERERERGAWVRHGAARRRGVGVAAARPWHARAARDA